jgi:tRNA pseudouridine55 synthase
MNGFLLVDKPKGITSFYCLKILRRLSNTRKIGFIGTLDPLASGLMIFAFEEATKLISFMEKADKEYEADIFLGAKSDTYDAEGKITVLKVKKRPLKSQIEKCLKEDFLGERLQSPPIFSAIQINGKRAYDLARKGRKVELKKRPVIFYALKVISYKWPFLKLAVHCGSGTYIRSLAHDLGEILGTGGYVKDLRRTRIDCFNVDDAEKIDDLEKGGIKLIEPQKILTNMKTCTLTKEDYKILKNGGFIKNNFNVIDFGLAILDGVCVGVIDKKDQKLKFFRKFNIIP